MPFVTLLCFLPLQVHHIARKITVNHFFFHEHDIFTSLHRLGIHPAAKGPHAVWLQSVVGCAGATENANLQIYYALKSQTLNTCKILWQPRKRDLQYLDYRPRNVS